MSNEKQESVASNAAKLREALEAVHRMLKLVYENAVEFIQPRLADEIIHTGSVIKAALAVPPRNCDRMNVDDAFFAFNFMCDNTDCKDCPYKRNNKFGDRELCAMLFLLDNGNGGKEGEK